MPESIVAEELALLERTRARLRRLRESDGASEASLIEELKRVREQLVRGEMDIFERSALTTRWNNQSAILEQLRHSRSQPRVDRGSPYFGHLRLREDGRVIDLCLGKATCLDHGLRIVDWRHAPIARIFYRYRQGEEFEEEIGSSLREGQVEVRRSVAIREGTLERVEAPEGVFLADAGAQDGWRRVSREAPRLGGGEGAALRVHEHGELAGRQLGTDPRGVRQRADKHLPDIAALIDPAQFDLITRPKAGFVVIRGTAGSGKTTVALHRIAFLAYEDPQIDSPETLFLVFSPALRDYVAHVLPALGVEHVQVRTFREWSAEQRRRLLPGLPPRIREDTPALVQRLKLHPALLGALDVHVARVPGEATPARVLDDWASVLTDRELLGRAVEAHDPGRFSAAQLGEITAWCRSRMDEVFAHLEGERDGEAELDPEDDAILLRAWQRRGGALPGPGGRPLRYRHIAIDEVQDFSPLEVRVLIDCLDARESLTLAGDTQQHVMQEAGFVSWSDFFSHLGLEGTAVDTLQVSYRSSREIAEFAAALLGPLREEDGPVVTTRSGPPVELFHYTDHGACIASLADALTRLADAEPLASAALLTPSRALSQLYEEGLSRSEVPRLHRVERQDFRFAPGIEITEIEQVKGLEFDYVVLIDVSEGHYPDDARSRRLLHVGATRAVHQLWLTSVGTPSKPVQTAVAQRPDPRTQSR